MRNCIVDELMLLISHSIIFTRFIYFLWRKTGCNVIYFAHVSRMYFLSDKFLWFLSGGLEITFSHLLPYRTWNVLGWGMQISGLNLDEPCRPRKRGIESGKGQGGWRRREMACRSWEERVESFELPSATRHLLRIQMSSTD